MIECEWAVICDYAITSQDGKVSACGIFDSLEAANFPATHPALSLVMRSRGEPNRPATILIEFLRPNGGVLHRMEGSINTGSAGVHYLTVNFVGLQFPHAGRYTFRFSADGRPIKSLSLRILQTQLGLTVPAPVSGTIH